MEKLIVSVSPHLRGKNTTTKIMLDVIIAMLPALIASVLIFGIRALVLTAVCVATCVAAEALFCLIAKKPIPVGDLSAVVTGMLLAFNLPVTLPIWQAVLGSVIAIVVVKQLFGGLGMNFANPALTARIALFLAFSATTMANYARPVKEALWKFNLADTDLITSATPLAVSGEEAPNLVGLLLGTHNGVLGETCALALIIGGIYLVVRKVITFAIRQWGSYPEGVSFSILFMNILAPYISNWTAPKALGGVKAK